MRDIKRIDVRTEKCPVCGNDPNADSYYKRLAEAAIAVIDTAMAKFEILETEKFVAAYDKYQQILHEREGI